MSSRENEVDRHAAENARRHAELADDGPVEPGD